MCWPASWELNNCQMPFQQDHISYIRSGRKLWRCTKERGTVAAGPWDVTLYGAAGEPYNMQIAVTEMSA